MIHACVIILDNHSMFLSRLAVPLIQGYEDAGDFSMIERLKTSIHVNLIFYLVVGSIGLFGLILVITTHKNWLVSSSLNLSLFSFYVVWLPFAYFQPN